jgi:hypothetical protein
MATFVVTRRYRENALMRQPIAQATIVGVLCCALHPWTLNQAVADDKPAPELLPAPKAGESKRSRKATPAAVIPCGPCLDPMYFRTSRNEIWQNYSVDRSGSFRLRVVYTPCESFYRYNGEPYPWVTTHPLAFNSLIFP